MAWPYTWNPALRRYTGAGGKIVSRQAVREALDAAVDAAAADMERAALALQAGSIEVADFQLAAESSLKRIHVSATAAAAGGWAQASAADWADAGRALKAQYQYLRDFARELENGLPLDGRFLQRARMYARSGTGTFEALRRKLDLSSGRFAEERRLLHSEDPCGPCVSYAAEGWTEAGTLPNIGHDCECLSSCRCTFERRG